MAKNESELIRDCATLYVSFALESFFTVIMGIIFSYLLLLITNKGRLQKPGEAMAKMVWKTVSSFWGDIYSEVKKWPNMKTAPIEARLALCRKANQGICAFTVLVGVLTLTRWAHFNNVNGFRYLGYCVTCPPKQAELVLLIAPTVPCYRVVVVFTLVITAAMLITGYGASVISGDLYNGSLADFLETGDWEAFQPTAKMYWLIPSSVLLIWLSVIQIPVLILWYKIKGGEAAGLPHGYVKLCLIVAVTWLAFPAWWLISFEGASLLKDTKLNAIGFAVLNVISKGSFTLHMLSVSAWHRNRKKREEAIAMGRRPSVPTASIFADHHEPGEVGHGNAEDLETQKSLEKLKRQETTIITLLRSYDDAPKDGDVVWANLEPTQRAYFLGIGITPASYKAMGPDKRKDLLEKYASIFDIMVDDKADENAIISVPPTEAPSRHTSVGGHTALEPLGDGPSRHPVVGQKVTTTDGVTGRVMKTTMDEIQLALQDGVKQTVRVEDLLKVVVGLTCIEGPEIAAWSQRVPNGKVYCSCGIDGKHGSTTRTPFCHVRGDTARVNGHLELFGFEAHDALTFTVFGHDDTELKDVILAEAKLAGNAFQEDGFENILPLTLGGQVSESKIGLMVFVFGQRQPIASQSQGARYP